LPDNEKTNKELINILCEHAAASLNSIGHATEEETKLMLGVIRGQEFRITALESIIKTLEVGKRQQDQEEFVRMLRKVDRDRTEAEYEELRNQCTAYYVTEHQCLLQKGHDGPHKNSSGIEVEWKA